MDYYEQLIDMTIQRYQFWIKETSSFKKKKELTIEGDEILNILGMLKFNDNYSIL